MNKPQAPNIEDAQLPAGFWNYVEDDLKYVIYSDTDSIFLMILEQIEKDEDYSSIAIETGNEINNYIKPFNEYILKKSHVDYEKYNVLDFKTEVAIDGLALIKKKAYFYNKAYALDKKLGDVYFNPRKGVMKGLRFIKGDTSQFVKEFGKKVLELALAKDWSNLKDDLKEIVSSMRAKYEQALTDLDFKYIGAPQKNQKSSSVLLSTRLYNTIFNSEVISSGQSVFKLPVVVKNKAKLQQLQSTYLLPSDYAKINYLSVPYNYDPVELRENMKLFGVELLNDFVPSGKEKRPRIFYTANKPTPIKEIIDTILFAHKLEQK